jgi:hypothetical protein
MNAALKDLAALQQIARRGAVTQKHRLSRSADAVLLRYISVAGHYADPLPPLRSKDDQELTACFQRDDMASIEADITTFLNRLYPEPCWEDDPFAFLSEFL